MNTKNAFSHWRQQYQGYNTKAKAFSVAKKIRTIFVKSYQNKMRGKFRIKVLNNIFRPHTKYKRE